MRVLKTKKERKTDSTELRRNSFEEGYIQKRKLNEVALTTVSNPSLEQVHEKRRLEALKWEETSDLSAKQRSARFKFEKRYKCVTVDRA